jgi:hypothetical protein
LSTSGVTSWELDRNETIAAAYRKIGIPGEGNDLSTTQITDGAEALNAVVAMAVTDGMPLWKRTTASETPSTTSQVYTLSNAVKVAQVSLEDTSGTKYDLQWKNLYDFNRLPTDSVGVPVSWTFQPSIQGGTLSIWPLTSDSSTVSTKTIKVVYQKEFDGFTSSSETLDFPAFWTLAIVYRVATVLAPEHGVPLMDRQQLMKEAAAYWATASAYGDEDGSLFIPTRPEPILNGFHI